MLPNGNNRMIAIPSIALLGLLATLSVVAAAILRRPWQRCVMIGCAVLEMGMAIFLVIISLT